MNKQILYFDMDNVLVDFKSGLERVPEEILNEYEENERDNIPGLFSLMDPTDGAVEAVRVLSEKYDCYILSTAPWRNPTALNDKLDWIKKNFDGTVDGLPEKWNGNPFYKHVVFTHRKDLCKQDGAWLIDDRTLHGASEFGDHHIHFLSERFPDWDSVVPFLMNS